MSMLAVVVLIRQALQEITSKMPRSVETLSTLAPGLEVHWRRLWRASNASVFNSWPWISAWWNEIGRHAQDLSPHLIFLIEDDAPLALLPLQIARDSHDRLIKLQPFSSGVIHGCSVLPEHPDFLVRPEYRDLALSEIGAELSRRRISQCDVFEASYMLPESDFSLLFKDLAAQHFGLLRKAAPPTYAVDLRGGFARYLDTLQPHRRSDCRRLLRLAEKAALSFEFAPVTPLALRELFNLHQRAWIERGEAGAFGQERIQRFHQRLIATREDDFAVLVGRLSDSEGALSVVYGFLLRDVYYFYQSGNEPDTRRGVRSNGIVAQLLTMQALAEMGVERYDFLAGEADYKRRLATEVSRLTSARLFRPTTSVAWAGVKRLLSRCN